MAHTKESTFYVTASDGSIVKYIADGGSAIWDNTHNSTTGDSIYTEDPRSGVGQDPDSTYCSRTFLPFDTSSLDNGATISAAMLYVRNYSWLTADTIMQVGIVQTTQAGPPAGLTTADYDTCGSTHSPTEGATRLDLPATDAWYEFDLNATGLTWINKTGYTKLGLRLDYDLDDTYISGSWQDARFWGYAGGTGYKPYLTVTYTISRYWVGGTGNWSDTAHWAYTSGGAGGASVPDEDMDVIFDDNSFDEAGQTCTINTTAACYSLDLSAVTNNPTFSGASNITIGDALTTAAGITWSHTGIIELTSTGTETFTSNSIDFTDATIKFNGAGSTWTLADALTISSGTLNLAKGTLNTDGKAVTVENFDSSNANTRTLTCGATAFTITGNWDITTATNLTLTEGTSTITLSGNNTYFKGGGETYNSLTLTGTPITITGSNTFGTLALTAAKQVNLTAGTTQTVTTFTATGTSGNLITIRSTTAGTAATLSKASGTVTCDYLDLKDSTAAGGATWKPGDNSTDSGNNTGWSQAWTDPTNAYSSDNTYATHTSPNGRLYAKVSKDGGTTWQDVQYVTFVASEDTHTYGNGTTELWGTTWKGSNVTDANFKVKVYAGSSTSFNYQVFGTANLDDDISSGATVTGINLQAEGKWDGTTMSLDQIKVTAYFGNSPLEIELGSIAYDSDTDTLAVYTGSAWRELAPTDSANFTGTVTISDGGLESEQGVVSNAYLRGGKMYVDHIEEHTNAHGIVLDDGMYVDHVGEATGSHGVVFDNDVSLGDNTISDVADPTLAQDAATKNYIDTHADDEGTSSYFRIGNTQIVFVNELITVGANTTYADEAETFPVAFKAGTTPSVVIQANSNYSNTFGWAYALSITNTGFTMRAANKGTTNNAGSMLVSYVAIGVWQ